MGRYSESNRVIGLKHAVWALVILLVMSCTPTSTSDPLASVVEVEDALHFYIIGDWGRKGEFNQKELADMMNKATEKVEPEFIISTGDNFYPNGVASVHDYQWIDSYEDVYDGYGLNCPWYVVLGNHDYRGNYQAQIDYSHISQRWTMPSQYFVQDLDDEGVAIRMVFIDTSPFEHDYYSDPRYMDNIMPQDTTAQLVWLDSVLTPDHFDWKIVVGHHPMYTGGKRSQELNTTRLHLEKYLQKHNVDVYFAGHEHDLQHIKPEGSTHHIISGAGSEVRKTGKLPQTKFAAAAHGFVMASARKNDLLMQFVDDQGTNIYHFTITKK